MKPKWSSKLPLYCFGLATPLVVAFLLGVGGCYGDIRKRSQKNFLKIESALLRYHEEHGEFPPPVYRSESEGPAHSWRVLLLPYLGDALSEKHKAYNYSLPWDHPDNISAIGEDAIDVFRLHSNHPQGTTHYLGIGAEDEWPSSRLLWSKLVRKGSDTFLLVEYPESDVQWMEPVW